MKKNVFLIILAAAAPLLFARQVIAADTGQTAVEVTSPITIVADKAVWDRKREITVFTGNVVASQKGLQIKADNLESYGSNEEIKKVIGWGKVIIYDAANTATLKGGRIEYYRDNDYILVTEKPSMEMKRDNVFITGERMERYMKNKISIVTGNARLEQKTANGNNLMFCEKAVYDEEKKQVVATGSPKVYQDKNFFSGEEIIFHVEDEKVEILKNVKIEITPEEKNDTGTSNPQ